MRILPVLDLMHGKVVRGIAGRRESYRPIESKLVAGSKPKAIASALANTFRASEIYVADLDAIRGDEPAWSTYTELMNCGVSLWIDAGVGDADRARKLADFEPGTLVPGAAQLANARSHAAPAPGTYAPGSGGAYPRISGIIAGLESLRDPNALLAILDVIGPDRLIFSLDLQQGQPLARFDPWRSCTPIEIARRAIAMGVRRMIVLDLAGVGVGGGVPTLELCRAICDEAPRLELTTGGGVRHLEDLTAISHAGCSAALVASALHDGRILPSDLELFASGVQT